MGSLTNTDFQNALIQELDNRNLTNDPTSITVDFLVRCINWAYRHISQPAVFRHRELEATYDIPLVASDFDYDISTATVGFQINAVESVVFVNATTWDFTTTRTKLRVMGVPDFMLRTHTTADRPSWYCVRGSELLISPGPSATAATKLVRMFVLRDPAPFTIDISNLVATTTLPAYWDEVIVIGAAYRACISLGNYDAAEIYRNEFGTLINEITGREYLTVLDTRPAQSSIEVMTQYTPAERF